MTLANYSDLAAFVAVAEARSFRGAAQKHGLSPSAVSEAIRRLEAKLDLRLLNRTTRSVRPTDAGQRLLQQLSPLLSDIDSALEALDDFRGRAAGKLRLNVPGIVSELVLPPLLTSFSTAYPGVTVEVAVDENFVDVLAAGFDAGIRYDEAIDRDMIAVPIGPRRQHYVTAAAPAYLKDHKVLQRPEELLEHACIRHRFPSGLMPNWDFASGRKKVSIAPKGPIITNSIALQLAAACAGIGIIHTFGEFVEPELRRGNLVAILADWCEDFSGPFLYYSSRRHMPTPLRLFVDHIKKSGAKQRPHTFARGRD